MNANTIKWLAVAAVALMALMFVIDRSNQSDTIAGGELLLPELKQRLNDVNSFVVTGNSEENAAGNVVTILRDGEHWTIQQKGGFSADLGKLRETLLALAEARKLEQKTSNPERLAQLGLDGPDAGGGTRLDISGTDFSYALIIGNEAQSKNRYVRLADDNQAWLIDRNPALADSASGWLASELLDIDPSRIKSVTVQHQDGEQITLSKETAQDSTFVVAEIPEGRELSYATVANGIAGVLQGLELEDVRRTSDGEPLSTTVFTTFDGLVVNVRRFEQDASGDEAGGVESWFAIDADYFAPVVEVVADDVAIDDTTDEEPAEDADESSAAATAADINAQHAGWQYRIADYKANLVARRWDDILKAEEAE